MRRAQRHRILLAAVAGAALLSAPACSAGDPPDPEAARATATRPGSPGSSAVGTPAEGPGHEEEPELSDAEDALLDALEERFEDQGVKDIRGEPGTGVTIRLEDELAVADAAPFCAAVREAGFSEVRVDIDHTVAACP